MAFCDIFGRNLDRRNMKDMRGILGGGFGTGLTRLTRFLLGTRKRHEGEEGSFWMGLI
jgi:hypothetical protein